MRRLPFLLCLAVALAGSVAGATQEAGSPGADPAVNSSAPAAGPAVATQEPSAAATSSGLPQAGAPPRTLRAYWHVFVAFGLAWVLLFGYALVLGRRFGALERQVKRLEGTGA